MSAIPYLLRRLHAHIRRRLAEHRLLRLQADIRVIGQHLLELQALHDTLADRIAQSYTEVRSWRLAEDVMAGRVPDRRRAQQRVSPQPISLAEGD